MDKGGFLIFGGTEANKSINKQIEALERELDIINGITAPLTQQELIMTRITELESQRVTLNQRISSLMRSVLADLTKIVIKAAVLNAFNRGQGGLGFMDFVKMGMNMAALIPGPQKGPAAALSIGFKGTGFKGEGYSPTLPFDPSTVPAGKITTGVTINNPIFLGSDMENVVKSAQEVSSRRSF